MKYIRTEDGIYTLITKDEPIYELNGKKYYCVEEQISSFSEDEVINQADTIEELCDEFVVKFNDNENHIEVHKTIETKENGWLFRNQYKIPVRHVAKIYVNRPFEIYGAI